MNDPARAAERYLSPAFRHHSGPDLAILETLDGGSGFSLFWLDVVRPVLEGAGATRVVEVGADQGANTTLLERYCTRVGGRLIVIEPRPSSALRSIVDKSSCTTLVPEISERALPKVEVPVHAVLLEGDLNYATTSGDLHAVGEIADRQDGRFPVSFIRSVSWPYARRDMYYDPERLPDGQHREFARSGMSPWHCGLVECGINAPFYNAIDEGGARNGVLTAVEDFMAQCGRELELVSLPLNNGIGILYPSGSPAAHIVDSLRPPPQLAALLETVEIARLNEMLRWVRSIPTRPDSFRHRLAGRVRRLGAKILAAIEGR